MEDSSSGRSEIGARLLIRQRALQNIDGTKFGWYHLRAILVAGSGFFTDAYDIFSINLVSTLLGYAYFRDATNQGKLPVKLDEALKIGTSAGAIFGQVLFGFLCDKIGRKPMYGVSLIIMIFTTLSTAIAGSGPGISAIGLIVFWRVLLGIGIGGDYPMSAVVTSEFASTKHRGRMMAAVFSMQGLGIITAALVYLCCVEAFKPCIINETATIPVPTDPALPSAGLPSVDRAWRIVVGFGCIPAIISLYYRLTTTETPRYTANLMRAKLEDLENTASPTENETTPKACWWDFLKHFGKWKNGKVLLGTAGSWFFLDIAFYGLGLNNSIILQAIGYANHRDDNTYKILHEIAVGNVIIQFCGSLPGYYVAVGLIDIIGRKTIQIGSFLLLTIMFLIIGCCYDDLYAQESKASFITLFVLCQFFMNFGANTTTFVVPGEVFPTRYRSSAHGVSAACGKLGAVMAQLVFSPLKDKGGKPNGWVNHLMQIFAGFMFLGFLCSWLIPETMGKTLEELSGEDVERTRTSGREEESKL